jgi:hypothetical protein
MIHTLINPRASYRGAVEMVDEMLALQRDILRRARWAIGNDDLKSNIQVL